MEGSSLLVVGVGEPARAGLVAAVRGGEAVVKPEDGAALSADHGASHAIDVFGGRCLANYCCAHT